MRYSYCFLVTVSIDAELTHKTKQRSSLLTEKSSLLTETATPVKQFLISSRLNQATEKSGFLCNLASKILALSFTQYAAHFIT